MSEGKPLPYIAPSRSRNREVWVGAFVILGVVATLTALFTLTDASLFRGRYVVQTEVTNAGGLRRGDPVQMRGVNIGRVTRFQIEPGGVMVSLEIEGEYLIPADSHVELRSSGLLGGMVANVVPGISTDSAPWGAVLPGSIERGVFDQVDELEQHATKALSRVQRLLDEETIQNVQASSQDLRQLLGQLDEVVAAQKGEIGALTRNLRRSATALEQTLTGPEIDRSLQRLEGLIGRLDGVAATLDRTAGSAASILARMDAGEGTLGRLSTDPALYDNLSGAAASAQRAADEVSALAADLRAHPKKYVQLSLF
ncbi:MAG: MlaD family protein [Gemmatimonadota bacterium]